PCDCESFGFAEAERRATPERIDEPATTGGGRSHPHRGRRIHRTEPPVDSLEARQSASRHSAVPHCCPWRASRRVHSLRASRHLLQLLPQPPLPEVSDRCPGTLDRSTPKRTSPD